MRLYHFSEDPGIRVFEPHVPAHRAGDGLQPLVYAIDDAHAVMYCFPRDCPRACFWPGPQTTAADRDRWFAGVGARMVIAVEAAWLDAIRSCTLYRYELPPASFALADAVAGHWVSREPVRPLAVEPVGDLLAAVAAGGAELRLTPSLRELWPALVRSTMCFSGTRLRNTAWWAEVFG
jgi:hypothetical protein